MGHGDMVLLIHVLVHPVDTMAHPTVPPGYRWAVHFGADWADLDTCLNAGWQPTDIDAALIGEAAAVCAARVAMRLGVAFAGDTVQLEHDPIAAGADRIMEVQ